MRVAGTHAPSIATLQESLTHSSNRSYLHAELGSGCTFGAAGAQRTRRFSCRCARSPCTCRLYALQPTRNGIFTYICACMVDVHRVRAASSSVELPTSTVRNDGLCQLARVPRCRGGTPLNPVHQFVGRAAVRNAAGCADCRRSDVSVPCAQSHGPASRRPRYGPPRSPLCRKAYSHSVRTSGPHIAAT